MKRFIVLIALSGCRVEAEKPLPVRSAPTNHHVNTSQSEKFRGVCGCDCGKLQCLYGNCDQPGLTQCCDKCTCIEMKPVILDPPVPQTWGEAIKPKDINKIANDFLDSLPKAPKQPEVKKEETALSPPGRSFSTRSVEPRRWIPVAGHPGLFYFGRIDKKTNTIVDITHYLQR